MIHFEKIRKIAESLDQSDESYLLGCVELNKYFLNFLKENISTLKPIDSQGHVFNFSYYWDKLFNNPTEEDFSIVSQKLTQAVTLSLFSKNIKELVVRDNQCFSCGKNLELVFENNLFKVRMIEIESSKIKYKTGNEADCGFKSSTQTRTIDLSSNSLMIADYFRLKDRELYEFVKKDKYININSNKGKLENTDLYLSKNIIHFFVGNSCPNVVKQGNEIIFGNLTEESKIKPEMMVITDMWAVTALTPELLIKVMKKNKYSEEDIEKYLLEFEKNRIDIEPGKYEFTFSIDNPEQITRPEFSEVFATLKKIS